MKFDAILDACVPKEHLGTKKTEKSLSTKSMNDKQRGKACGQFHVGKKHEGFHEKVVF